MDRRRFLGTVGGGTVAVLGGGMLSGCAPPVRTNVLVIGGGLAGLNAGRVLQENDVEFMLLEGASRFGGRVYTILDGDEVLDIGANQIGKTYGEMLALLPQYGLEAKTNEAEANSRTDGAIFYDGKLYAKKEWGGIAGGILSEAEAKTPFGAWVYSLLGKLPKVDNLDFYGKDGAIPDVSLREFMRSSGFSEKYIELADLNLNGNLDKTSVQDLMRRVVSRKAAGRGPTMTIDGGLSQLPERMAAGLNGSALSNKFVRHISKSGSVYTARCDDGSSYSADMIISAIPFSVLQKIKLDVELSDEKRWAIDACNYVPVSRSFIRCSESFWKTDDIDLPVNMSTDTPLGIVYSNAKENIIGTFAMGNQALEYDKLLAKDANAGLGLLEQIRPSASGKLELIKTVSWGQSRYSHGAFSSYTAGSLGKIIPTLKHNEDGLYFAGEHTETFYSTGMEAALNSGSRVGYEILKLLGKV